MHQLDHCISGMIKKKRSHTIRNPNGFSRWNFNLYVYSLGSRCSFIGRIWKRYMLQAVLYAICLGLHRACYKKWLSADFPFSLEVKTYINEDYKSDFRSHAPPTKFTTFRRCIRLARNVPSFRTCRAIQVFITQLIIILPTTASVANRIKKMAATKLARIMMSVL